MFLIVIVSVAVTDMVKKRLLSDRQRFEITKYLEERPSAMPDYVRSLRGICKTIDFETLKEDLKLMEQLARLKVKIGRKSAHRDQRARLVVRHPSHPEHPSQKEMKASFEISEKKLDEKELNADFIAKKD